MDDFVAEAKPEEKLKLIRQEQAQGRLGGDDRRRYQRRAGACAGRCRRGHAFRYHAAKEAANLIDLDSDPTKLIDLVAIGKQMLITRGALTTFSIANDVAKYFAILPGMFIVALPGLSALNVMHLGDAAKRAVGVDLQRAYHPGTNSSGVARRSLPPGRCRGTLDCTLLSPAAR